MTMSKFKLLDVVIISQEHPRRPLRGAPVTLIERLSDDMWEVEFGDRGYLITIHEKYLEHR